MSQKSYTLTLYNTETRTKQTLPGNQIKMYTCGPTVYNFAHIGNFRTYVFEDLLRRTIKFFGNHVEQVMNITDLDDKTLKGALEKGISLKEFTEPYTKAFFEDLDTLGIERAEHYPKATDYIDDMIAMIQQLLDKGFAYKGLEGSVYFSIKKFPSYGRLSHLKLDELVAGASDRIAADDYDKEMASDFVLWKAFDPERDGNIFWQSPFGPGRPGWHIECSAMATKILGKTIDIHIGGVDNMFPHHENEIAQSECASGCCFVKHWLHSEHLLVDHKKMSKRLGNFYTLRDLITKGYSGKEVRYALMQTHYRVQLNFTFQGLDAARSSLERLEAFIARLSSQHSKQGDDASVKGVLATFADMFAQALADDLNISLALAALFDLVREINVLLDAGKVCEKGAAATVEILKKIDYVLGIIPFESDSITVPEELKQALAMRQKARQDKDWKSADHYRDLIHSKGYEIEDTPQGARLKLIRSFL